MKDYYFYKIVCNDLHVQHTYVGSTENFTIRKNVHKYDSTNPKRNHIKIYTTMAEHGGWSNWEMVLIEKRGFETRLEAKKLERYYYEQLNSDISLNTIYPQRDRKEYLQLTKNRFLLNRANAIKKIKFQLMLVTKTIMRIIRNRLLLVTKTIMRIIRNLSMLNMTVVAGVFTHVKTFQNT